MGPWLAWLGHGARHGATHCTSTHLGGDGCCDENMNWESSSLYTWEKLIKPPSTRGPSISYSFSLPLCWVLCFIDDWQVFITITTPFSVGQRDAFLAFASARSCRMFKNSSHQGFSLQLFILFLFIYLFLLFYYFIIFIFIFQKWSFL